MGLRLRLTPTPKRGLVTGCTLSFTTKGKGPTPADGEHTASIEFYEVAGRGDKATQDRKIGKIDGTLKLEGGKPFFTASTRVVYERLVEHTDFLLDLEFLQGQWDVFGVQELKLPWEVASEGKKLEVGVRLLINGAVHADLKANKPIDVPFVHKKVPNDAGKKVLTGYGVEAVYPEGNDLLKGKTRIPIGTNRLNIYLHEGVRRALDRGIEDGFKLSKVRRKLVDVFQSGGFTKVAVEEKDDAAAKAHWKKKGGRWVASKMKTDPDTYLRAGSTDDQEGNDQPFFDFWVFHESSVTPIWNEAGEAEILNTLEPLNAKAGTKRILLPTVIVGSTFDPIASHADDGENAHNLIVDTIAHEIGHALGLRHSLYYDGQSYTKHPRGLGVMSQMTLDGGEIPLKRFSPVERAELEKRFL